MYFDNKVQRVKVLSVDTAFIRVPGHDGEYIRLKLLVGDVERGGGGHAKNSGRGRSLQGELQGAIRIADGVAAEVGCSPGSLGAIRVAGGAITGGMTT